MRKNSFWNKALILSVCFHLGIIPCVGLFLSNYLTATLSEKPIELELVMSVAAHSSDSGNPAQQAEKINQPPKPQQPPQSQPQQVPQARAKIADNNFRPKQNVPVNNQKPEVATEVAEAVIDREAEGTLENSGETPVGGADSPAPAGSNPNNSSANSGGGQSGKSGGYIRPQLLNKVEPVYPENARAASREGIVSVSLEVLSNGRVGNVAVRQSSGHTDLDDAAVRAVKRWRFVPAKDNLSGRPVTCLVNIPVVFQLK